MPQKVKNKEQAQKKENKMQQDNKSLQKNDFMLENNPMQLQNYTMKNDLIHEEDKMSKKEKAELSDSHNQLVSALKMDAGKKEYSEKNKFAMTSDKGYAAVLSQLKKEQKLVDSMVGNLEKARKAFRMPGEGGAEYEALQQALSDLNWAEHKEDMNYNYAENQKAIEKCYTAVEEAALRYIETHNRHHATLQGSRRLKYAKILLENVRNHEYLKERQINLKEEVSFAKEDAKKKYVKGDKIIKVSPSSKEMDKEGQEALRFYSMDTKIFNQEGPKAGIHFGPYQEYNPYQFVNGIRRGIIKKEELEELQKNYETMNLSNISKTYIKLALRNNERMDHLFDHNQGLGSTAILYRGIGVSQMKSMLNLAPDADLSNMENIAEQLESLIGKVVQDNGFISTSRDKAVGEDFARKNTSPIGMMMEIVTRKGTPMIDLSKTSGYGDEQEQLIKNGTKMLIRGFRIQQIKDDQGKVKPLIVLKAEMRRTDDMAN